MVMSMHLSRRVFYTLLCEVFCIAKIVKIEGAVSSSIVRAEVDWPEGQVTTHSPGTVGG